MQRFMAIALLAACEASSPYGADIGTPTDPAPQQASDGSYQIVTAIDLTAQAVLPPQAELVVEALQDFSTNPARTLIDLAGQAGVPAVTQLYDALPSQLTDQLEGWINGYLDNIQIAGKPITTWAGDVAGLADAAFSKFDLDSGLAITGLTSTHTLTQLDFTPTGVLNIKIPLSGLAADILTQHPSITVGKAGALGVGDQGFGMLFGEYAWTAVNSFCTTQFGADIRTTLGNAVNCANLARDIANKCLLTVCVGNESLIDQICEGGLDAMVQQIHDRFDQINLEALHFASGTATLVDDNGDGIADRITNGTWDAEMNLGLGLRQAPATFTGTRDSTVLQ